MNEAAEQKLVVEWTNALQKINRIWTFRRAILANEAIIRSGFQHSSNALANEMIVSTRWDKCFKDKKGFFEIAGGQQGFADFMAASQMKDVKSLLDASSIVMLHSVIDNYVFELINVIKILSMRDFGFMFKDKQIKYSEAKCDEEELIGKLIEREKIDRKSLLDKIDILFQLCSPPKKYAPIGGYEYKSEYLQGLDDARHDIIHKSVTETKLLWDFDFMKIQKTLAYFICLLHERYEIKINPTLWQEYLKKQGEDARNAKA